MAGRFRVVSKPMNTKSYDLYIVLIKYVIKYIKYT